MLALINYGVSEAKHGLGLKGWGGAGESAVFIIL